MLPARRARSCISLLTSFLLGSIAHAEDHCSAAGGVNGRLCNLGSYLHTLEAIVALLAVILIVVIALAIAYYRKAQRMKLEP